MKGNTSARTRLLLAVALLTAVSLLVTDHLNTQGQSDVDPVLPIVYHDVSHSGHLTGDDGEHHNYVLDSDINVNYRSDDGYHCDLVLQIRPDWTMGTVRMIYSFVSEGWSSPVPIGSETVLEEEHMAVHSHTDPLTGDVLTFRVIDGELGDVSFSGRTVLESSSGRSFLGFDITVGYRASVDYVGGQGLPLPRTIVYDVTGTEGGSGMSGSVTVRPMSAYTHYNDEGEMGSPMAWYSMDIDIPGSVISGYIDGTDWSGPIDPSDMSVRSSSEYLSGDVLITVSVTLRVDPDSGVTLEGYIVTEVLDGACSTVSTERIDLHYEGIVV